MIPVYAYGFFNVCSDGTVIQHVIFSYVDPLRKYASIVKDVERLRREIDLVSNNMQRFLDNEDVRINDVIVYPKVVATWIGFSGSEKRPYIEFLIVFKGSLRRGINVYEDRYEPDIAEYDYSVVWVFPQGSRIVDVDVGFEYEIINDNILRFNVPEGSEVPGYERISFYLENL